MSSYEESYLGQLCKMIGEDVRKYDGALIIK